MRATILVLALLLVPSGQALAALAPSLPVGLPDPIPATVETALEVTDPVVKEAEEVEALGPAVGASYEDALAPRAAPAQPPAADGSRDSISYSMPQGGEAAAGISLALVAAWLAGVFQWVSAAMGGLLPKGIRLPFAGGFSRIKDDELLDNPTRRRIQEAVRENPGISLTAVSQRVGVAWGTTVRHLERLESRGLVSSVHSAAGRQFFAANTEPSRMRELWAAIAHPTAARIARFVHDHPGADQTNVCSALGLRNPAASKHLARFQRLGLVATTAHARHRVYAPTTQLRALLAAGGNA